MSKLCLVPVVAVVFAMQATAQQGAVEPGAAAQGSAEPLSEQIARLVDGDNYTFELHRLGIDRLPIGELVDALVPLRTRLRGHLWVRALGLITPRASEVDALWRDEPGQRRARAAVFAAAIGGWELRYREARAGERNDIEVVAQSLPAQSWAGDSSQDSTRDRQLQDRVQRIAAAAERLRGAEVAASLRAMELGSAAMGIVQGDPESGGVFSLADALLDNDEALRLRAAIALRLRLQLEVPIWLAQRARADTVLIQACSGRVRFSWSEGGEEELQKWLADLEADRELVNWPFVQQLDAAQRRRLAKTLIAYALRVPAPPWHEMTHDLPNLRARDVADGRASGALACAASLGDQEHAAVVALAAASPDVHVTLRVLASLSWWSRPGSYYVPPMPASTAAKVAPILVALLDHQDPLVVERAAALSSQVVPAAPGTPLAAAAVERALEALLLAPGTLVSRAVILGWCGTRPLPAGQPSNRDSWLVLAACKTGDARLLAPLLAALRVHLDAAGRLAVTPGNAANLELLLSGVASLAPHLDAVAARQLHDLLAPTFVGSSALGGDIDARQQYVRRALAAVMPWLPKQLLEWHAALPPHERLAMLAGAGPLDRLGEATVDRLIGPSEQECWRAMKDAPEVFLGAPARLAVAWQTAGPNHDAAVEAMARMWMHDADAVVALVAGGALSRSLAAAGMDPTDASLRHVAAVVAGQLGTEAASSVDFPRFVWAVEHVRGEASVEQDLAALQVLAESPGIAVALAAVRRASTLGDAGASLAAQSLQRWLGSAKNDDDLAQVLQLAVELHGVIAPHLAVADLAPLLARLRAARTWLPHAVADAAAMRFFGQDPRQCEPGHVVHAIMLAGIDVEREVLQDVVAGAAAGQTPHVVLAGLLTRCSPTTTVAALQLAAEQDQWDGGLQKAVAWCTQREEASVRLAAYRALASLDADLWPCAWLVHEAVFDPDPAVQQLAREAAVR